MGMPNITFQSYGQSIRIFGLHEDEYIFGLIKQDKQFYESDLLDFVRLLPLREGSVIDVGANLGNHTVFFSLVMDRATHAFEISPENLSVLRKNVETNGVAKLVTIHELGLHSENTTGFIQKNLESLGLDRTVALDTDNEETVDLRRLDDVISTDEPIVLIKIGLEGGELDVLRGAQTTLKRHRPVCLVKVRPGPMFADLAMFFADHEYQPTCILGRSDTWVFVHSKDIDLLKPYIDSALARSAAHSNLVNEARILMAQGEIEQVRSATNTKALADQTRALSNRAQLDEFDRQNEDAIAHIIKQIGRIARDEAKAQKQIKKLDTMLRAHVESMNQRTFKQRVKNRVKAVAKALNNNRVSRRLILILVPKKVRTVAARRIFGRGRGDVKASYLLTQLVSTPTKSEPYQAVLICPAYPGGKRIYGGEFIRNRAEKYVARGLDLLILEVSTKNKTPILDHCEGVAVLRTSPDNLELFVQSLEPEVEAFLTHSPTPETVTMLNELVPPERQVHWFHGFDIRDYRRLYFDYSTSELAQLKPRLDELNRRRKEVIGPLLANPLSKKVFVSKFLKYTAETDMAQEAHNAHVIPNFISEETFKFSEKRPEQARQMLLIRSFAYRNYANDIAIEAISLLRDRDGFEDITFTIRGFGEQFRELTDPISDLANVSVVEGLLSQEDIVALHSTHGVFLCPTRFDSQGVSMGQAMASGLVCITNGVAAIPEYTDQDCSVLVRPDDPGAFAEAIWDLHQHPQRLPLLSRNAGSRVRRQCGADQTIEHELALIPQGVRKASTHV